MRHTHQYVDGRCACGVTYAQAHRGFGSNVSPRKQRSWRDTGGAASRKKG